MKEHTDFTQFYNICISIIRMNIQALNELSTTEKIKFVRENIDKNILNAYHLVGEITQEAARAIESKTTTLKFSVDNMIKNILEHPEITCDEYRNISLYIRNAEYILKKNNKNLIYFKIDNKIYQFVVKNTKIGNELFVTTFHKASVKQLAKDICRYLPIKKDSSDCEDSKYPSVT